MHSLADLLDLEFKTITAMVNIYCKAFHKADHECIECREFLIYANEKLDRCPYGEAKPTCKQCPIHCYKPEQRQLARNIMSYAGPRMLIYHPILAIKHLQAEKRAVPSYVPKQKSNRHSRKIKL